jgi:hypothetical protein
LRACRAAPKPHAEDTEYGGLKKETACTKQECMGKQTVTK